MAINLKRLERQDKCVSVAGKQVEEGEEILRRDVGGEKCVVYVLGPAFWGMDEARWEKRG